ncbi:hypothetical protein [Microcystis phage Mwe-JY25]
MGEKLSERLRAWSDGEPECPCREAADALDALKGLQGQVVHFEDGDFLDVGVGDRQRIVRDLPARPCALLLDMQTREIVGLRIYGARAALGGDSGETDG